MVHEPFEKEQFGVACFEPYVGKDAFLLYLSSKRRIGENNFKKLSRILPTLGGRQRVMKLDMRFFELV